MADTVVRSVTSVVYEVDEEYKCSFVATDTAAVTLTQKRKWDAWTEVIKKHTEEECARQKRRNEEESSMYAKFYEREAKKKREKCLQNWDEFCKAYASSDSDPEEFIEFHEAELYLIEEELKKELGWCDDYKKSCDIMADLEREKALNDWQKVTPKK
jgi:hypothetical protein